MARTEDLKFLGFSAIQCKHLGNEQLVSATATGNDSQNAGLAVTANIVEITTITGSGNSVTLPLVLETPHDHFLVANFHTTDDLNVFPGDGDAFNRQAQDAKVTISPSTMRQFFRISNTRWLVTGEI